MDQRPGVPLLLALFAMLAVVQGPRLLTRPTPAAEAEERREADAVAEPAAGAPAAGSATAAQEAVRPGWAEPLRLHREFLGLSPAARPGSPADLQEVAGEARGRYRLESIVALVPDPVDSNLAANFDQEVEALQMAGGAAGYLLDRMWLPWTGDAAKSYLYREAPGVLLFRRSTDKNGRPAPSLLAVYLVGETPKQGIHKRAFGAAVGLAARLEALTAAPPAGQVAAPAPAPRHAAAAGPPGSAALPDTSPAPAAPGSPAAPPAPAATPHPRLRVLGPSFSGSAPSLGASLAAWQREEPGADAAVGGDRPSAVDFEVVTGSATAPGLEQSFPLNGVTFARTVLADDELQRCAFEFLQEELGWEPAKIALLAESDTAYGQQAGASQELPALKNDPCPQYRGAPGALARPLLTVSFPSGLSSLRSAWEKDEADLAAKAKGAPVAVPRGSLGLSLADQSRPVDIVPQFSTLSTAGHDLALSNLLGSIWRGGIRYVGILATDARDKLFLAERIRRFAPDMVVFTLDNNLLYAHPQHSAALDGTLVLSSFPLYPENERWREVFGGPDGVAYRRQFTTEFQQGTFLAAQQLLGQKVPAPRGWIAAVGNGTLWPVASFPPAEIGFEELAGRGDLQLLLIAALLCLLALWLRTVYPPAEMYEGTGEVDLTARRLLAFGCAVLAALGAVVAVLGTLPFWASGHWHSRAEGWDRLFEALYLAALAAAYLFLVWSAARVTAPPRLIAGVAGTAGAAGTVPDEAVRRRARSHRLAWGLAGVLLLLGLVALLPWSWMPGGEEYFYLRARKLTSGLSPAVSLLLLGGAFCSWVLMELKRRRLIARQAIAWPLRWRLEPPLEGVRAIAEPVYELMQRTFPYFGPYFGRKPAASDSTSPPPAPGAPSAGAPPSPRLAAQGRWFWTALAVVLVPPAMMLLRTVQPICESRAYGRIFLLLCLAAFCLATVSLFQFIALWLDLDRLLQRLDHTRLTAAFRRVSAEVAWSPMRAFGWRPPNFKMIALTAEKLHPLLYPAVWQELRGHLEELFRADQAGDLGGETQARREIEELFARACEELAPHSSRGEVEDFFAVRIVAFLRPVVAHMRNCLTAALLATLFLLFAVRSYAFEPQWFVSVGIWAALAIGVAVTLWVFVQMDRNASLSAIGNTLPGKVTFDRHFFTNVLTYGAIPLIGIVVTQFPQISRFVTAWLNPALRVAGVG